jgi:LAS superfamily LD-carboxypeptidase LdcB
MNEKTDTYKNLLRGKDESELVFFEGQKIHQAVVPSLKQLIEVAEENNYCLRIASGHRSYERQQLIWDEKALGKRPLLDDQSKPLVFADLSPTEIMHGILKWSAVPGISRHHWGSDFDIFEQSLLPEGYQLKLVPEECLEGGVLTLFYKWLEDELPKQPFIRPYYPHRKGVGCEPWHLSYKPLAEHIAPLLTKDYCLQVITESKLELREILLQNFEEVFETYIKNV